MSVDQNNRAYTGRVIGSKDVAGLCQFANNSQAAAGVRKDRALAPEQMARALGGLERLYDPCNLEPVSAAVGGGAATGTAGDENVMQLGPNSYEYSPKGTQTILAPKLGAAGLDINMDQTDNDGIEIVPGSNSLISRYAYTIGTDKSFEFRLSFSIADVSGTDDCAMGFRKVQAYEANLDDYTDMAALNVISGDINIETILNDGATSTTDTTDNWADGETHELKVRVLSSGRVLFFIDGVAPTTTASFTFDSGDVVVPFFFFLNASDVAGAVQWQELEVGRVVEN